MEAGSGISVTMFEGCNTPSNITRIPAGAEMFVVMAMGMRPLSHLADESRIWHLTYHFEPGGLRLGALAPDVFQKASRTFPRKNSEIMQSSCCMALARSGCD